MAFPTLTDQNPTADNATGGAAVNGSTLAGSHVVNLPATVNAGDLLMIFGRVAVSGTVAITEGGWSIGQMSSDGSTGPDVTFWGYRDTLAAGTEGGTSITVTHGSGKMVAVTKAIAGAEDPAIQPPQASTAATGSTNAPNPTTCTPTGGAKDYFWNWFGAWEGEQTLAKSVPTNYTGDIDVSSGTGGAITTNVQCKTAHRTNNAASEDPAAISMSVSDEWTALCIAVHPRAPGVVEVAGALEAVGEWVGDATVTVPPHPVRSFNGSTDQLELGVGGLNGLAGFGTFAAIFQLGAAADFRTLFCFITSGGTFRHTPMQVTGGDLMTWNGSPSTGSTPEGVWCLGIMRKGSGTVAPRFSLKRYDTGAWTHTAGSGTAVNGPTIGATDRVALASDGAGGEGWQGLVAVMAAWTSLPWSADATGDAALEAAGLEDALINWVNASPQALWPFDQAAVTTAVEDIIGAGDQVDRLGTTVVTNDPPPHFDWTLANVVEVEGVCEAVAEFAGAASVDKGVAGALEAVAEFAGAAKTFVTTTVDIAASADDGFANAGGAADLTNPGMLFGASANVRGAWRFNGLAIPQAGEILTATLKLEIGDSAKNDAEGTLYGEDVDNALEITTTAGEVDNYPATTATVSWTTNDLGTLGQIVSTPDLAAVIQEIVDRAGWRAGYSLKVLYHHPGTTEQLSTYQWDDPTHAPGQLVITHEKTSLVTIAGASEAVAEWAAEASVTRPVEGALEAVAEWAGDASVGEPPVEVAGAQEGVAEWAGDASVTKSVAGASEAVAEWTAAVQVVKAVDGAQEAVAEWAGAVIRTRTVEGASEAVAEWAGAVIRTRTVAGAQEAVAEWAADATLQGQKSIEGALHAVAEWVASASVTRPVAGVLEGVATWAGAPERIRPVSGSLEAVAEWAGAYTRAAGAVGVLEAVATFEGSISRDRSLEGVLEAVAEWAGEITAIAADFVEPDTARLTFIRDPRTLAAAGQLTLAPVPDRHTLNPQED